MITYSLLTLTKSRSWDSWTSEGQHVWRRECIFLVWSLKLVWRSSVPLPWTTCKIADESENEEGLPLSRLDFVLIPCSLLHVSKPQFSYSCLVTIWSTECNLHANMLEAASGFSTSVICCTIQDEYDVISPPHTVLRSEATRKSWQKQLHYILVSVALSQCQPNVTFRWDCYNHIHLVSQHSVSHGVVLSSSSPAPSTKVCLWYPRLINVDDMLSFTVDFKHSSCI